jgi:formate dehydrogenase iron-sulfur subunit
LVPLASLGQITFWTLLAYLAFRLSDLAIRGGFEGAFAGRNGALFLIEIGLGGLVPLVLLSTNALRSRPGLLCVASLLTLAGIVLNRVNIVILAMQLRGPMPWTAPSAYVPSFVEWGLSLGLLAATVFLFGAGVRWLPILPKYDEGAAPQRS